MLIFVQVCRTIDKKFSIFKSSIGHEEQMKSNGFFFTESRVRKTSRRRWTSRLGWHLQGAPILCQEQWILLQGSLCCKKGYEEKRF